jgi:hypothetical protein
MKKKHLPLILLALHEAEIYNYRLLTSGEPEFDDEVVIKGLSDRIQEYKNLREELLKEAKSNEQKERKRKLQAG